MPWWELKFWEAKFAKEPPPQERLEWMLASLTATTVNQNRGNGKKPKKIEKFMLFRNAFKKPMSDDKEVDADINTIMEGLGGNVTVNHREKPEADSDESLGDLEISDNEYLSPE